MPLGAWGFKSPLGHFAGIRSGRHPESTGTVPPGRIRPQMGGRSRRRGAPWVQPVARQTRVRRLARMECGRPMPGDELALEPEARSPAVARRWLRGQLTDLGREQLGETAELLVTEVVTNALLHAGTQIRVRLRPEGRGVRVEVADESSAEPVRRSVSPMATIGRGLATLDQLASDWGWTVTDEGKTVWFLIRPDPSATGRAGGASTGPVTPPPSASMAGAHPDVAQAARRNDQRSAGGDGAESGLGRYADGLAGESVEVCLLGLPVRLLMASQEHHDALIRELRLMALAPSRDTVLSDGRRSSAEGGLVALVEELGVRHAAARARRDREIQDAFDAGLLQIDQVFSVPVSAAEELRKLVGLLAAADLFCDQNALLTLARPPLIRRFSAWYLEEIIGQVAGRSPIRWTGPLTLSGNE